MVSRLLTWLLSVAVVAILTAFLVFDAGDDPEAYFEHPGYCAIRFYDTTLDIADAASARHPWLSRFLTLTGGSPEGARHEAIDALQAVHAYWETGAESHPDARSAVRAYLAILLLESGRPVQAHELLDDLAQRTDAARVVDVVAAAYPELGYPVDHPPTLEGTDLWSVVPWGWAARVLIRRLQIAQIDVAALGLPDDARTLADVPALASLLTEIALWVMVIAVGLVGLVLGARRGRGWIRVGDALRVAPWSLPAFWAFFVRGLALTLVVGIGLLFVWDRFGLGGVPPFAGAIALLPLVLLARSDLLRPHGLRWGAVLGIPTRPHTEWKLVLLAAAAVAADTLGGFGILALTERAGLKVPWTEAVMEQILVGPPWLRALFAIEAVLFVPLLEETVFRGLLYPTLRRLAPPLVAALASGIVFSGLHGYGIVGTAVLLWGSVVAALAYERTGTLLVPILMHAATNASVISAHWRMAG